MPTQEELWPLIAASRQGILATIGPSGRPQLSNILYAAEPPARLVRISTTADRAKAQNLIRDPRASLHVSGRDFWHYAVAVGTATLSEVARSPGDDAVTELEAVHGAFYGQIADRGAFAAEMISNRRIVIRLSVDHLYGVLTSSGRRPQARVGEA